MSIFDDPKVMLWVTCRQDAKAYTVELRNGDECLAVMAICPDCDQKLLRRIKRAMEEARLRANATQVIWTSLPSTTIAVRGLELDSVAELLFPKAVARLRARPRC